jgi:mono/diheme cytochrome c family protein
MLVAGSQKAIVLTNCFIYQNHILNTTKNMILSARVFLILVLIASCNNKDNQQPSSGEQLAKTHCGSCHALPEPALLDKNTWKDNVLPVMAEKLGLDLIYEMPLGDPQKQVVSVEDFKKIANWYYKNAPDSMARQNRLPIREISDLFNVKTVNLRQGQFPSASYIKIDPGNHWIYAANAFDSSITIYDYRLTPVAKSPVQGTLIDIHFDNSLQEAGNRKGVFTLIGIMNPNDLKTGRVHAFTISKKGFVTSNKLFDSLPRPVQTVSSDMDMMDA